MASVCLVGDDEDIVTIRKKTSSFLKFPERCKDNAASALIF